MLLMLGELYLIVGVICGVIAFFLTLSETGFNVFHMFASALSSVLIVFVWPAWLYMAVSE